MFLFFVFTVDASNTTTTSPPQPSSIVENPSPATLMTSSDTRMPSSTDATDGVARISQSTTPQQDNLNSSVQTPQNMNHTNNNNNNNSENVENYNESTSNKSSSKKSLTNASHFSAGSGILSDTPPPRPARRQYVNKSK